MNETNKKTQTKQQKQYSKKKKTNKEPYINELKIQELISFSQQQLEKGFELFKDQQLERALQITQESYDIRVNLLGKYHSDVFVAQNLVSQILVAQKNDNQALIINQHMIKDLKKMGNNNVLLSMVLHNQSQLLIADQNWQEAQLLEEEALQLNLANFGPKYFATVNCQVSLGLTLVKQMKYQDSLNYLEQALQCKEKQKAPLTELFEIYILLGEIYNNIEYIAKSLFYYQKCYDIQSEFLEKDSTNNLSLIIECYKLLEIISNLYFKLCEYDEAQNSYEKLLELGKKIFSENSSKLESIMIEIKKCQNEKYYFGKL